MSKNCIKIIILATFFCQVLPDEAGDFIIPHVTSNTEEHFIVDDYEYVLYNYKLSWAEGSLLCRMRNPDSTLIIVDDEEKAFYLAEVLAETNLPIETVWIGGRRIDNIFVWIKQEDILEEPEPVNTTLLDTYLVKRNDSDISNVTRDCMAFSRNFHEYPLYITLNCHMFRQIVCQIPHTNWTDSRTSSQWFLIKNRYYKIFHYHVDFANAVEVCRTTDPDAHLAVIEDMEQASELARFMAKERPPGVYLNIEKAWIGAKWFPDLHKYRFLSNYSIVMTTDNQSFPIWKPGTIHYDNRRGCVLLDRHMNRDYFLVSSCNVSRYFICSKMATFEDYFIDYLDFNVRLYMYHLTWYEALESCAKINFTARLVAVDETMLKKMILVMGENVTLISHLWIGGHYNGSDWLWVTKNNEIIPKETKDGFPPWVKNTSYLDYLENEYVCLNLDRENHNKPLFYGTTCYEPQHYACQFDEGQLQKLIDHEKQ